MNEKNTKLDPMLALLLAIDRRIDEALEKRDEEVPRWQAALQDLLADLSKLTIQLELREQRLKLLLFGSDPTEEGEFPECVAIGNEDEGFFASGVLLSKKWLLTSSHARTAEYGFAGIDINGKPNLFKIQFDDENDLLALFKVENFTGQNVKIVPPELPPDDCFLVSGTPMQVVAFGNTDPGGGTFGRQRKARFDVDDAGDVRIYASSQSGVCTGDSGGPAFYFGKENPRMLLAIADSVIGDDCDLGGVFATLVGKATWINDRTRLNLHVGRCPDLKELQEV